MLITRPDLVGFRFAHLVRCLSSGVLGGGFQTIRAIVNLHVDKNYAGTDPAADIADAARNAGLPGPYTGLMTAVMLNRAIYRHEAGIHVLVTAGVANATAAGIAPAWDQAPGTINIIAYLEQPASDGALTGGAITITEAKAGALAALGVRCHVTGAPATGTSSDAFALAASIGEPQIQYLGPVTREGSVLARLVREAVTASLATAGG